MMPEVTLVDTRRLKLEHARPLSTPSPWSRDAQVRQNTTTCWGRRVAGRRHSRRREDAWRGSHRWRQHIACRMRDFLRACAGDEGEDCTHVTLCNPLWRHACACVTAGSKAPAMFWTHASDSCKQCRATHRMSHHSPCREGVLREAGACQVGALLVGEGALEGVLAGVAAVPQMC